MNMLRHLSLLSHNHSLRRAKKLHDEPEDKRRLIIHLWIAHGKVACRENGDVAILVRCLHRKIVGTIRKLR